MSNKQKIEEISGEQKEPTWVRDWREKRLLESGALPSVIKHGIGISALFPEIEPDFADSAKYHVNASKGIEIYTWKEAMTQEEIEPIVKGLMESDFFPTAKDHFRALGQALFRSGLVIYVQPNMKDDGTFIKETLTLDTVLPGGSSSDVVIVILKEGAQLECTLNMTGGVAGSMHTRSLVVLSEQEGQIRVTQCDTLSPGAMVMHASRGVIAGHGNIVWREFLAGNALISSVTESMLIGGGASATVLQGIVASESAIFDVDVSVRHLADETLSTIRTAGTADGTSRILYRGLVDMQDKVRGVRGAQEATFLALAQTAKIDAIPSLDIASNDVNCSHKLTISHIREGDTFYPKLRGFSTEESKELFLEGHFGGVFSGIENTDMMSMVFPSKESETLE